MNQYLASIGSISKVTRFFLLSRFPLFRETTLLRELSAISLEIFSKVYSEQIDSARRDDEVEKSSAAALVEKGTEMVEASEKADGKANGMGKGKRKVQRRETEPSMDIGNDRRGAASGVKAIKAKRAA
ncbi:hypothetical protein HZH66_009567 [Vespula vulgaris]|uniref:Uncharacterized protein n=1 Tax=Vespula vulgaris TaxID=7454 RepID=A0A834JMY5_VESVU|nr:hypothetical protein HZH66_009567 [Vespula vulgaris]